MRRNNNELENVNNNEANTQTSNPKHSRTKLKVLIGTLSGIAIGGLIAGLGTGFGLRYTNTNTKSQTNSLAKSVYPSSIKTSPLALSITNNNIVAPKSSLLPILTLTDNSLPSNAKNVTYYWYFNASANTSLNQLSQKELQSRSSALTKTSIVLNDDTTNAGYWLGAVSYELDGVTNTYYSNTVQVVISSSINDLNLFNGNNSLTANIYNINGANNVGTASNPKLITLTSSFNWKSSFTPSTKDGDAITYTLYSTNANNTNTNNAIEVTSQKSAIFTVSNPFSNLNYFVVASVSYNGNTYNNVSTSNLVTINYNDPNASQANPTTNQKPSITSNALTVYYNSTLKNSPNVTINLYNPLSYSVSITFSASNNALATWLNDNASTIATISATSITLNLANLDFATYSNNSFNLAVSFSYNKITNGTSSSIVYSTLTSQAITLKNITSPVTLTSNTNSYDYANNITSNVYFTANINPGMYYLSNGNNSNNAVTLNNVTWYYSLTSSLTDPVKLATSQDANYTLSGMNFNSNNVYIYAVASLNYNNQAYSFTTNSINLQVTNKQVASSGGLAITTNSTNYVLNSNNNFNATISNKNNITLSSSNFSITNISLPSAVSNILAKNLSYDASTNTLTFNTSTILKDAPTSFNYGQFLITVTATYSNNEVSTTSQIINLYHLQSPVVTTNNITELSSNNFNVLFTSSNTLPNSNITNTYATILTNSNKTDLDTALNSYDFSKLQTSSYAISNNTILNNKLTTIGLLYYAVLVSYAVVINNQTYYINAISNISTINVINAGSLTNPTATLTSGNSQIIYANGINSIGASGDLTNTVFTLNVNSAWTLQSTSIVSSNSNLKQATIQAVATLNNGTLTFNWNDLSLADFQTYNQTNFLYELTYKNANGVLYVLTLPATFSLNYIATPVTLSSSTTTLNFNKTTQTGASFSLQGAINSLINTTNQTSITSKANIIFSYKDGGVAKTISLPYSNLSSNLNLFSNSTLSPLLDTSSFSVSIVLNNNTISNSLNFTLNNVSTTTTPTITFGNNFTNTLYVLNGSNIYISTNGTTYSQTNATSLNLDATITNQESNGATSYISGLSYKVISNLFSAQITSDISSALSSKLATSYANYSASATLNTSIDLASILANVSNAVTNASFYIQITATITNTLPNGTTSTGTAVFNSPMVNYYNLQVNNQIFNTTATINQSTAINYTTNNITLPAFTQTGLDTYSSNSNNFTYNTSATIPPALSGNGSIETSALGTSYALQAYTYHFFMSNTEYYVLAYSNVATITTVGQAITVQPNVQVNGNAYISYFKNDNTTSGVPSYAVLSSPTISVTTGSYNYGGVTISYYNDKSVQLTNITNGIQTSYSNEEFTYTLTNTILSSLLAQGVTAFNFSFNFIDPVTGGVAQTTSLSGISLMQTTSTLFSIYASTNTYNSNGLTLYSSASNGFSNLINNGGITWYYASTNTSAGSGSASSSYTISAVPDASEFKNGVVGYYAIWIDGNIEIKSNVLDITFPTQNANNILTLNNASSNLQTLNDLSSLANQGTPVGNISINPGSTSIYYSGSAKNLILSYHFTTGSNVLPTSLTLINASSKDGSTSNYINLTTADLTTLNTWLNKNFASSWYTSTNNTLTITVPASFISQLTSLTNQSAKNSYQFTFNIAYSYSNSYGQTVTQNIISPVLSSINPISSYNILTSNLQTTSTDYNNALVNYASNVTLSDVALWAGASSSLTTAKISNKKLATPNSNNTLSLPTGLTSGDLFVVVGYYEFSVDGVSFQVIIQSNKATITINNIISAKPTISSTSGEITVYNYGNIDINETTNQLSTSNTYHLSYSNTLTSTITTNNWTYTNNSLSWTTSNATAETVLKKLDISSYVTYSNGTLNIDFSGLDYTDLSSLANNPIVISLTFTNGSQTATLSYTVTLNVLQPFTTTTSKNTVVVTNSNQSDDITLNITSATGLKSFLNSTVSGYSYYASASNNWTNTEIASAIQNGGTSSFQILQSTSQNTLFSTPQQSFSYAIWQSAWTSLKTGPTGPIYIYGVIYLEASGSLTYIVVNEPITLNFYDAVSNSQTTQQTSYTWNNTSSTANNIYFTSDANNSNGEGSGSTSASNYALASSISNLPTSIYANGDIDPSVSNNLTATITADIPLANGETVSNFSITNQTVNNINNSMMTANESLLNTYITSAISTSSSSNTININSLMLPAPYRDYYQFTITFDVSYNITTSAGVTNTYTSTYSTPIITVYNIAPSITYNGSVLFANASQTVTWNTDINLPNASLYWNDFVTNTSASNLLNTTVPQALKSVISSNDISSNSYSSGTYNTSLSVGKYYGVALAIYTIPITQDTTYYVLVWSTEISPASTTPNVQVLSEIGNASISAENNYVLSNSFLNTNGTANNLNAIYQASYIPYVPIGYTLSNITYNWGIAIKYTNKSNEEVGYYHLSNAFLKSLNMWENESIGTNNATIELNNNVLNALLVLLDTSKYLPDFPSNVTIQQTLVPYVTISAELSSANSTGVLVTQTIYQSGNVQELSNSNITTLASKLKMNNNTQSFNTNDGVPLQIYLSVSQTASMVAKSSSVSNNVLAASPGYDIYQLISNFNTANKTADVNGAIWQITGISWYYNSIADFNTYTLITQNTENLGTLNNTNNLQEALINTAVSPSTDLVQTAGTYYFYPAFDINLTYQNKTYDLIWLFGQTAVVTVTNATVPATYSFSNQDNWFSTTPSLDQIVNSNYTLPYPAGASSNALGWIWNASGFTDSYSGLGSMLGWGWIKNASDSLTYEKFTYESYGTNPANVNDFGTNFNINTLLNNATLLPTSIKNVVLTFTPSFTSTLTFANGNIFEGSNVFSYSYTSSQESFSYTYTYNSSNLQWVSSSNWHSNTINSILQTIAKTTMNEFASAWPSLAQKWNAFDTATAFNNTSLQISFAKPSSNPFSLVINLTNGDKINIPLTFTTDSNWGNN